MKTKKMTDEEVMHKFLEMLEDRVSINTGFVKEDATGNITHQVVEIRCGEYVSVSQPEALAIKLRVATGAEQGATIN